MPRTISSQGRVSFLVDLACCLDPPFFAPATPSVGMDANKVTARTVLEKLTLLPSLSILHRTGEATMPPATVPPAAEAAEAAEATDDEDADDEEDDEEGAPLAEAGTIAEVAKIRAASALCTGLTTTIPVLETATSASIGLMSGAAAGRATGCPASVDAGCTGRRGSVCHC